MLWSTVSCTPLATCLTQGAPRAKQPFLSSLLNPSHPTPSNRAIQSKDIPQIPLHSLLETAYTTLPYLLSCTKIQQNMQPERLTFPLPLLAPPSLLTLSTKPSSSSSSSSLPLKNAAQSNPPLPSPAGTCRGGPNLTVATKTTAATPFSCSRHTLRVSFPRPFCPPG